MESKRAKLDNRSVGNSLLPLERHMRCGRYLQPVAHDDSRGSMHAPCIDSFFGVASHSVPHCNNRSSQWLELNLVRPRSAVCKPWVGQSTVSLET